MRFMNHKINKIIYLFVLLIAAAGTILAQNDPARLKFDQLNKLESKADEVVEVNIDGKMLELAKRVLLKVDDKDAKTVGEAIKGLKAVYVRVYNFEKESQYSVTDVDEVRSQLSAPGWERMVNIRSKKDNAKVDVFTMFLGDTMSGLAVVVSDPKSVALINVIGPIDIDTLVELSGHINIPRIDIEKNENKPAKPKNN